MKNLRHKIQVSVADRNGDKERVLSSTSLRIPQRLLGLLFGEFTNVLVITPGKTVESVVIKEIGNDGGQHGESA